jgi:ACS family hexuronate transporter-like MFS transporter
MILASRGEEDACPQSGATGATGAARTASWQELLRMKQTWGIIIGKALSDPVWFFITDWFAIYLVARGFRLENTLWGFWIPFLAADFGNFFGGGLSSWLIRRGWPVLRARKLVIVMGGLGVSMLGLATAVSSFPLIITLFAIATFSVAALTTMVLAMPSDLYPTGSVATVSGMSGTGAGIGTIISTFLVGRISTHYSFGPILAGASMVPLVAAVLVLVLVRKEQR